jgi:hypothetical protein
MKKRYIIWAFAAIAVVIFALDVFFGSKTQEYKISTLNGPRIGQKLWTYNMNKYEWRNHSDYDEDDSKGEIVLQYQGQELGNGYTSYKLLTGNFQVPKEDVWVGEGSQEFLIGKNLYSYFPRTFEYYQVVFNGVKFVTKKLSQDEISALFKDYEILKLSDIQKGEYVVPLKKGNNKFLILNDGDKDFYKYYIVPNDSKNMQIERFSNQFEASNDVDIKIQRLEGCTKEYPCYEFSLKTP